MQRTPTSEESQNILECIREWEDALNQECESFGGDTMLSLQEEMAGIKRLVLTWADEGSNLFSRHTLEDGSACPDQASMLQLNSEIDELMAQFTVRLTGDNGVAHGVISLINILESWDSRLHTMLQAAKPIPESEWLRFYALIDDWLTILVETRAAVGSARREDLATADWQQLDPTQVSCEARNSIEMCVCVCVCAREINCQCVSLLTQQSEVTFGIFELSLHKSSACHECPELRPIHTTCIFAIFRWLETLKSG